GEPVRLPPGDELDALAREIDRLRELLHDKVGQLEELNRHLETVVESRTKELSIARDRLELLREVANAVNSSLDFRTIFDAVVTGTRRLVDFDQATICRLEAAAPGAATATI